MATVEDEDVRLTVPLSIETVNSQNIDEITIFDTNEERVHVIPVSPEDDDVMENKSGVGDGQLRYEQYLGRRPFHGQYTVVAMNRSGEQVDSITIEFNCFADGSE